MLRLLTCLVLLAAALPLAGQGPVAAAGGVVNAADYTQALAPGGLIAIFGTNLAPRIGQAASAPLPRTLEGVSVDILDGAQTLQAPLVFVSPGQINAQMPYEARGPSLQVRVRTAAGVSAPVAASLSLNAPRFFTKSLDGQGEAIVLHADYGLVSAARPAGAGEVVIAYLTGLGAVTPAARTGERAGDGSAGAPLNRAAVPVEVRVGGQTARVHYAGLAPGWIGLYQLNVELPAGLLPGEHAIEVFAGAERSQRAATVVAGNGWLAVGTSTVGSGGGVVSQPGVRVTLPAGCVASERPVTVWRSNAPDEHPTLRTSGVYALSGMPDSLTQPVTVAIELDRHPGADESYVVVRTAGPMGAGSMFLKGSVTGNRIEVTIPATQGAYPSMTRNDRFLATTTAAATAGSEVKTSWSMWSIAGMHALESPRRLFKVVYPVTDLVEGNAEEIAKFLDTVYDYLKNDAGLDWGKRNGSGSWPLEVTIEPFTGARKDRWGEEGSRLLGVQRQGINLNASKLSAATLEAMKLTAAHEVFHVLQNLYDPAGGPGAWLWFEEAASTWLEKRLAKDPNYIPATVGGSGAGVSDNYAFLVRRGLEFPTIATGFFTAGNEGNVQEHGYGASLFLEYLGRRHGVRAIGTMLKEMETRAAGLTSRSRYSPVEAIHRVTGDAGAAWRLFCEGYMDAGAYAGQPRFPRPEAELLGMSGSSHTFTATDSGPRVIKWNAADLSASLYFYRFNNPGWTAGSKLKLALTGSGEAEMVIYKFKSAGSTLTWTRVAIARSEHEIDNVETMVANGEGLAVLVANGRAVSPYQSTTELELTVGTEVAIPKGPKVKMLMDHVVSSSRAAADNDISYLGAAAEASCGLRWGGMAFTGSCSYKDPASPFSQSRSVRGSLSPDGFTLLELEIRAGVTSANNKTSETVVKVRDFRNGSIVSSPFGPVLRFSISGDLATMRRLMSLTVNGADFMPTDPPDGYSLTVVLAPWKYY